MQHVQPLALALAGTSLLAPLAAAANEQASLNGAAAINAYMEQQDLDRFRAWESQNQVTSINQFADVRPTDWAYQALTNLIERYGCVAGYPEGSFKGGQAMTRYEAAALLNACLDRVTEVTDELQRLMKEFEKELAVLKGRVDTLEAKVGQLEATQFSTTTKLQGDVAFYLGGVSFGGSQDAPSTASGAGPAVPVPAGSINNANRYAANNNRRFGALTLNYDARLNLSTSFSGKDLLYTRLRTGNFGVGSAFSGAGGDFGSFNLLALDRAYSTNGQEDITGIDRLYYQFPIGKEFRALVGARARNTEFLAITPSFYRANLLDVFALHGAPATYNKATGSMLGLVWKQKVAKGKPYVAASTSYVAPDGFSSSTGFNSVSTPNGTAAVGGGLFNPVSKGSWLTQVGIAAPQWALTAAWRYGQCGDPMTRRGSQFARQSLDCSFTPGNAASTGSAYTNNFALNAAWQPAKGGSWIPSVSLGWGISAITQADYAAAPAYGNKDNISQTQSWNVALQWDDAFVKGNAAGFAFGQPTYVTALNNNAGTNGPDDGNYVFEWWYKFQVSDNISITPTLFYLSRPNGQYTAPGETNNAFGALVATQFKF